jgi:hypothetical protein
MGGCSILNLLILILLEWKRLPAPRVAEAHTTAGAQPRVVRAPGGGGKRKQSHAWAQLLRGHWCRRPSATRGHTETRRSFATSATCGLKGIGTHGPRMDNSTHVHCLACWTIAKRYR